MCFCVYLCLSGPLGDQGDPGREGERGVDGRDGRSGFDSPPGFRGPPVSFILLVYYCLLVLIIHQNN